MKIRGNYLVKSLENKAEIIVKKARITRFKMVLKKYKRISF